MKALNRILLTHALALSAINSQLFTQEKPLRTRVVVVVVFVVVVVVGGGFT